MVDCSYANKSSERVWLSFDIHDCPSGTIGHFISVSILLMPLQSKTESVNKDRLSWFKNLFTECHTVETSDGILFWDCRSNPSSAHTIFVRNNQFQSLSVSVGKRETLVSETFPDLFRIYAVG